MNNNEITVFAQTNFRNQARKFGIKTDDRRRHTYLIGKTGMGKSVTLENMIIQDIIAGKGLCVVDPHGELVEKVIKFIPPSRINDVVYINPADLSFPIAFNVLESVSEEHRHLVASGLLGIFKKLWAESWGPRLEYVLNNAIMALLEYPGSTLLGVMRLLVDKSFRKKVINKVTDPIIKSFWVEEYSKYPDRFQAEAIAPIQNKVGRFLSSAMIRNIVGQVKSSIDLREIMDQKKILLLNLSKGRIGEDNAALLGAMIITKIQLAAMSRVEIPEAERKDFYLYVDEFQNFATESFANILSEARKYRLDLIMAHQYIAQLTSVSGGGRVTKVKDAVFGNVGTIAMFRIGAPDAEELIKEFEPYFVEEDLVNLTKYHIYLRLMIDGVASKPFSATTLPPTKIESKGAREKVVQVSRERYANRKSEVEEKIMRWSGLEEMMETSAKEAKLEGDEAIYRANYVTKQMAVKAKDDEHREQEGETGKKEATEISSEKAGKTTAVCDNCGKAVNIKFKPDNKRNVFCKECLKKFKRGEIDADKLLKRNLAQEEVKDDGVIYPQAIKNISQAVGNVSKDRGDNQKVAPGQVVTLE